jgi:hypothetical protein
MDLFFRTTIYDLDDTIWFIGKSKTGKLSAIKGTVVEIIHTISISKGENIYYLIGTTTDPHIPFYEKAGNYYFLYFKQGDFFDTREDCRREIKLIKYRKESKYNTYLKQKP